ncbi:MAG: hypothetical protein Q8Q06_03275 [bacterium]|nr:hypothetical protein [bacterium]
MPGMHTFSDQFGCAVVTKYDDGVARVKRFRICPGGEVFTTWDSEASVKYNRGDDPYWVNLGKPEKEAR